MIFSLSNYKQLAFLLVSSLLSPVSNKINHLINLSITGSIVDCKVNNYYNSNWWKIRQIEIRHEVIQKTTKIQLQNHLYKSESFENFKIMYCFFFVCVCVCVSQSEHNQLMLDTKANHIVQNMTQCWGINKTIRISMLKFYCSKSSSSPCSQKKITSDTSFQQKFPTTSYPLKLKIRLILTHFMSVTKFICFYLFFIFFEIWHCEG